MKKILYLCSLLSAMMIAQTSVAQTQPTTEDSKIVLHLDQMFKVTANADSPFKLELKKVAGNTFSGVVFDYSGVIKSKGTYVQVGKKYLEDGHFIFYYQDGQIESEGEFDRGVKVGSWKRFDSNGKRKSDKYYPEESADKIRESMLLEKDE